jgi:O-antigen/teichoic acid export membrane protein
MTQLKQIKKDTISNYLLVFVKLFLSLLIVPIYLKVYGEEQFGIYLLSFGLVSSLSFLDFGSSNSIIRFAAAYQLNNNKEEFQDALTNNLTFSILASIFVALIVFFSGIFSNNIFKVNVNYNQLTKELFYLASVFSLIYFIGLIPSNILQGFSVFQKRNKLQLIIVFLTIGLVSLVYIFKINILLFCLITVLINLISVLLDCWLIYKMKLLQGIKIKLLFSKALFKNKYFNYSFGLFLLSLAGFFSQQIDKFILSTVIGFSSVAIYTIITKPYFIVKSLFSNIYSVMQPLLIKEHENKNYEKINIIIIDMTKLLFGLITCASILVITFFNPILQFWLHTNKYNNYSIWGCLAMLNLCLITLFGPIYRFFYFTGNTKLILKYDVFASLLNSLISVLLAYYLGFQGVIIGTTIQMIIMLIGLSMEGKNVLNLTFKNLYNTSFLLFVTAIGSVPIVFQFFDLIHQTIMFNLFSFILASFFILTVTITYFKKEGVLKYIYNK